MPMEPLVVGLPGILTTNISPLKIFDPGDPLTPNTIIETNDPWSVEVDWSTSGTVAPALGVTWKVQAFLESMDGKPDPGQVGPTEMLTLANGHFTPPNTVSYKATINVGAGVVPAGLYKLNVAVTTTATIGGVTIPIEMAGFDEGPLMQFYVP